MSRFLDAISATPLVFDGAMGTMIYAKGVFLNACYDELCLTRPDLVRDIHREYAEAGADVLETNSFTANRVKLARHGLADRVRDINLRAAQLARDVAGADLMVAGSVGPCLSTGQIWQPEQAALLREAYAEQIRALAEGGVDVICFETFAHLDELRLAAAVCREVTAVPLCASFTVNERGETAVGGRLEAYVAALTGDPNVDVIGLNCGVGPAHAYDAAEQALALTAKPLIVMPNAGLPREVEGRMLYLTNPEYFTEYAKKLVELGVRGIGGCCGTTPAHIREAARAVKSLSQVKRHVEIHAYEAAGEDVPVVPPETKSRFAARLLRGERVTSVELLPPRTFDLAPLLAKARACHDHGVDAINIPDGPRASARVSPMIAAMAILREVGIEPILHYCCRDRNLIGMQSDLLGGYAAGLRNFLIITGDPPKLGDYPYATGVFDVDAIGLTRVVSNLNHGRDVGGNPINPPTGILIGVGANPCAVSPQVELDRFCQKVEAGAEFAITQPVFDAEALFRFLDQVEARDRCIPVVAGVWPLTSFKNAEFMRNEVPGVEVPDRIIERMRQCATKEDGIRVGIDIARDICESIASRVAGFQVSAPFGKVDIALDVIRAA